VAHEWASGCAGRRLRTKIGTRQLVGGQLATGGFNRLAQYIGGGGGGGEEEEGSS
jgi:hypothetical protein